MIEISTIEVGQRDVLHLEYQHYKKDYAKQSLNHGFWIPSSHQATTKPANYPKLPRLKMQ